MYIGFATNPDDNTVYHSHCNFTAYQYVDCQNQTSASDQRCHIVMSSNESSVFISRIFHQIYVTRYM